MRELSEKLKLIQMLVVDVDGVMTTGQIWLDSNNEWKRAWCVRDGSGIKQIQELGFLTGAITAAVAADVKFRLEFLGIPHVYTGSRDKLPAFRNILEKTGLQPHQIAYMGDDIYDVPVLREVGFAASVPGAMDEARDVAHYITKREAGFGAVREVCDLLRKYGHFVQRRDPT